MFRMPLIAGGGQIDLIGEGEWVCSTTGAHSSLCFYFWQIALLKEGHTAQHMKPHTPPSLIGNPAATTIAQLSQKLRGLSLWYIFQFCSMHV